MKQWSKESLKRELITVSSLGLRHTVIYFSNDVFSRKMLSSFRSAILILMSSDLSHSPTLLCFLMGLRH